MSDEKPEAEKVLGVFLNPGGGASEGGYIVPMHPLTVGPGEPGPEDEWHLPVEPTDIPAEETTPAAEPALSAKDRPLHWSG
jgi:hypothetical protein